MVRRLRHDWMGEDTGAVLWRATGHSLCQGQPAGRVDECFGEMDTFCIMALNFSGSISNKLH